MIRLVAGVISLAVFLVGAPVNLFAQPPSLNWGSEVNPSRCPTDQGYRYLEINVTRKVENDPTTVLGTTWAVLEYNQHIQVWKIGTVGGGGERFCALVRYQGSFTTLDGASPQGTDLSIAAGIDGSFEGGYRLVFNADELSSSGYSSRGHIGTFNGPIGLFNFDWRSFYFTGIVPEIVPEHPQWWGWIYHGGNNGAWVYSSIGNQGDITD
jgi:hypothetical protein